MKELKKGSSNNKLATWATVQKYGPASENLMGISWETYENEIETHIAAALDRPKEMKNAKKKEKKTKAHTKKKEESENERLSEERNALVQKSNNSKEK